MKRFINCLLISLFLLGAELPSGAAESKQMTPNVEGSWTLPVRDAFYAGESVHWDEPSNLAVGWKTPADQISWTLQAPHAGTYQLQLRWQIDHTMANQPFEILLDGKTFLRATVPGTHGRSAPELRPFGMIDLKAGKQTLTFKAAEQIKGELIQLRSVTLVPEGQIVPVIQQLKVPEGFVIEEVAGQPLVTYPMMGCLDDRGRLFLSESSGVNNKKPRLLRTTPHNIVMLEDTDQDGKFDKRTIFADNMVLPNGGQWLEGSLYVASAPYLWKLTDTNDDGVADKREKILGNFNFTGMSDSMHGPTLGPDGRLYFCGGQHGWEFTNKEFDPARGDDNYPSRIPGVFSCWPDGSDPENLGHGGTANPVEVTFTPEGEALGTLAILDHHDGRHDALLHWIYGGVYNIRESYRSKVHLTGDLLEAFGRRGHVAPAGITRYRSDTFGKDYWDNLFLCEFNTQKIHRVQLSRTGSTFSREESDFLTTENPDVHFTDVIEDEDGSLLIINTGGWFRYGCPTSQVAKRHILGGIYRIRKAGVPYQPKQLKDWSQYSSAELVKMLETLKPADRDRIMNLLVDRGEESHIALKAGLKSKDENVRRNIAWVLTRQRSESANRLLHKIADDQHWSVRLAAVHGLNVNRDVTAETFLALSGLYDEHPAVRRESATALGRFRAKKAVPNLLGALVFETDRFLEHAILYALIQIEETSPLLEALTTKSAKVQRGALIVLSQIAPESLSQDRVLPLLKTTDESLQLTVLNLVSQHPEWAQELLPLLKQWMVDHNLNELQRDTLQKLLVTFKASPEINELVAHALTDQPVPEPNRLVVLRALSDWELKQVPENIWQALQSKILVPESTALASGVTALSKIEDVRVQGVLTEIALNSKVSSRIRLSATFDVAHRAKQLENELFQLLLTECVDGDEPVTRLSSASAIGGLKLTTPQFDQLLDSLPEMGPLELPGLLHAFEEVATESVLERLLEQLKQTDAVSGIAAAQLQPLWSSASSELQQESNLFLKSLGLDPEQQAQQLNSKLIALGQGSASLGERVFFGKKATCSACHQVAGRGGIVGPNLSKIGAIRQPRDLLESIMFPSASFARDYESVTLLLDSGKTTSGILSGETESHLVLVAADRAEQKILRDEIEEIIPGKISVMPQGLEKQLSNQELSDLIAYLRSLK